MHEFVLFEYNIILSFEARSARVFFLWDGCLWAWTEAGALSAIFFINGTRA